MDNKTIYLNHAHEQKKNIINNIHLKNRQKIANERNRDNITHEKRIEKRNRDR